MASSKILTLEQAKELPAWPRALCLGCFDPFHIGHLRHFKAAKQLGQLVVAVTVDSRVNKGPNRPMFPLQDRMEVIAALEEVSYVVPNEDAVKTIQAVKPKYYVKGSEYRDAKDPTGGIGLEKAAVEAIGGELTFTDEPTSSSTSVVRQLSGSSWAADNGIRMQDIHRFVGQASFLKVLVLGEFIEDLYVPCIARHMQAKHKGPSLDVLPDQPKSHCGGAYAVARHVRPWVHHTTFLTGSDLPQLLQAAQDAGPGTFDRGLTEVGRYQSENFDIVSFQVTQGMVKTRYVDGGKDVVQVNTCGELSTASHHICQWLDENIRNFDLVIVADFGHGLVSHEIVEVAQGGWLAAMAQTNSSNFGFNTLNRYSGAQFVSCNRLEADLSQGRELMAGWAEALCKDLCPRVAVTKGTEGAEVKIKSCPVVKIPYLKVESTDPTGTGDAFLALSSLAARTSQGPELIGLLGSAAGAIASTFKGNERGVQKHELLKFLGGMCS